MTLKPPQAARTMQLVFLLNYTTQRACRTWAISNKDTVTMHTSQRTQRGASAFTLIIILAIIGTGTFIGLQYIPQYIEASTVDSILSSIETAHEEKPVSSANSLRSMLNKQLDVNQMDDLRDSFKVTQDDEIYIVEASYERELNLIYEKKLIKYEKTLILK
ncbi:MAG TPA: hypothetical protein DCO71_02270 [Gammaproteobacteria bacterium]|nr:hypothetical protein [Gammaproteobacteria bacterium]